MTQPVTLTLVRKAPRLSVIAG
ncbi:hypothetical protein, partial [Cronobacter sakazakii]